MLHGGQFVLGHPAPGRQLNRSPWVTGNDHDAVSWRLMPDIEVQVDDDPAAGFLATVKFIVNIPGWLRIGHKRA